ncbi:ScbA/BarX family gamma-butyrolactone biosynthesis protein [Streptomyces justiciae]|uniref:ScbA/BarX family gamma-butyrolactone biosynthesis protein n=1 Tax=Streptomyces justiciae TaxID=2780140 RepID=A0ABU3M4B6_9ACTN|nr:ScbA/BarX family gamma-butyrolactone biosynthesis protein [Streptomyces justiciae]MDT7846354.1 ScbA/BarX family gamma-butyrolactone biosynthesis protein [Streptomyces justiciae]
MHQPVVTPVSTPIRATAGSTAVRAESHGPLLLAPGPEAPAPPAHPQLSYLQPVPRHMVHRAAIAEVFLTDAVRTGEHSFLVAAQWPRDHAVYSPGSDGTSDPLLFMETIRQALVYLAHAYYDVPLTHRFIGFGSEFEITDPAALRIGGEPVPVVLEAEWVWVGNRPPNRFGMRLEVALTVGGRTCGRGALHVVAVDDKRYAMLRGRGAKPRGVAVTGPAPRALERVHPAAVGRLRAKDSVLVRERTDTPWQLLIDVEHPIFFDHPSDHVPLMVTLEGFRQLGHLLLHPGDMARGAGHGLLGMEVDCQAFGELDAPIDLVVRERQPDTGSGTTRLTLDAVQNGASVATCRTLWGAQAAHVDHRVPVSSTA